MDATVPEDGRMGGMSSLASALAMTLHFAAVPMALSLANPAYGSVTDEQEPDAPADVVDGSLPNYQWKRGDEVRRANDADIVDSPPASGMPSVMNLRSAEVQVFLGATLLGCPSNTPNCEAELGSVAGVAWYQRPTTWFSWGLGVDAQQFSQRWTITEAAWSVRQRALAGRIFARVHVTGFDGVDPYIGVSLGGAGLRDSYQTQGSPATTQWIGSPLYGARAGLTVHATEDVHFGGFLDWTNIQRTSGESCPWVVGGVCSSNNWSAFPPSNALWNVGLTVSFAFGDEL